METIKNIFTSKKMVAFYLTTIEAFIATLIIVLSDINIMLGSPIIGFIIVFGKYLNVEILQGRRN